MRFVQFILVAVITSGFLMSAHAQAGAHLEIVSATSMPLKVPPGEQEKILPANMLNSPSLGPYIKDAKKYKEFNRNLEIAESNIDSGGNPRERDKRTPGAVRNLASLPIAFNPRKHDDRHQLIVASPAGMRMSNGWSGVERFISIPNVGKYKLTEFDLIKTGGKFFLASESVTTNIDNSPAAAKTFIDDDGNIVEEIVWVSDGRFHMLTFLPETKVTSSANLKEKRAAQISATALAQGLIK